MLSVVQGGDDGLRQSQDHQRDDQPGRQRLRQYRGRFPALGGMAVTAGTAKINSVSLITPFGNVGPAVVKVKINAAGLWTIANATLPPGYVLNAALPTAPAVTIIP